MIFEIFFFIFITFFIRLFPRLIRPLKIDTDTWYHISSVNSIIKNKYKIPKCNFGFILGGNYDYPFFAHWLTSLFVGSKILKLEKYISPLVDTIYITIGFFYLKFVINFYSIEIDNFTFKYFLLMIFSLSMIKISTGPRIYSFTPRIFGELFIFIFFISIHLYFITNNEYFIFLAILFSALALNTSTFGSQVLILSSCLLSILLSSFIPFFSFILSIVFAYIMSFGHYKNILLQQLKYSYKYATYGQFNHPAVKNRNKIKQYVLFFKYLKNREFKLAYSVFMSDLTFINIFYKNIDILVAFFVLIFAKNVDIFIFSMFVAFFIIFILTSFKPFLFLGESDRYLDYLVVFSVFIMIMYLPTSYLYIIILFQVVLYLFTLYIFFNSSDNYGKDFIEIMNFIKDNIKNKNDYVIHGILGAYINYPLSVLTGLKSLAIETNYVFDLAMNKKIMPNDRIYTSDFEYLYNEYGVNIIVANKKYLYSDMKYNFDRFEVLYENDEYIAYIRKNND
ncbi:hypothetical protein [Aliarcobacter butzleri]|uniref:hypothetical protein n=1 Tax=Aliarcobacter butzleri TaxID=28197 RepID=UPI00125F2DAE|nr:hypothetical protein [Aliarcobacter butzleri]MDN5050692.1 hypothetical protein [Aliarcobacter butzleri]MDN5057863.1 hypothetical protein [Aliarcobacter butzleri]